MNSALGVLPPAPTPALDPPLCLDEAARTAYMEIDAGAHDDLTVSDQELPFRDSGPWEMRWRSTIKRRWIRARAIQDKIVSQERAKEEVVLEKLETAHRRRDLLLEHLDEVEGTLGESTSRIGLAFSRVTNTFAIFGQWLLLFVLVLGDIAFNATALLQTGIPEWGAIAVASLVGLVALGVSMGYSFARRRELTTLAQWILWAYACYSVVSALSFAILRWDALRSLASKKVENVGTELAGATSIVMIIEILAVTVFFIVMVIATNLSILVLEYFMSDPLIKEARSTRKELKTTEKQIEGLDEERIHAKHERASAEEEIENINKVFSEEIDSLDALSKERQQAYDEALLQGLGSPDATNAIASLRGKGEPREELEAYRSAM